MCVFVCVCVICVQRYIGRAPPSEHSKTPHWERQAKEISVNSHWTASPSISLSSCSPPPLLPLLPLSSTALETRNLPLWSKCPLLPHLCPPKSSSLALLVFLVFRKGWDKGFYLMLLLFAYWTKQKENPFIYSSISTCLILTGMDVDFQQTWPWPGWDSEMITLVQKICVCNLRWKVILMACDPQNTWYPFCVRASLTNPNHTCYQGNAAAC